MVYYWIHIFEELMYYLLVRYVHRPFRISNTLPNRELPKNCRRIPLLQEWPSYISVVLAQHKWWPSWVAYRGRLCLRCRNISEIPELTSLCRRMSGYLTRFFWNVHFVGILVYLWSGIPGEEFKPNSSFRLRRDVQLKNVSFDVVSHIWREFYTDRLCEGRSVMKIAA